MMNKPIFVAATLLVVVALFQPLQASEPAIEGRVAGIELCPQFICGNALFTGIYRGEVDGAPAIGTWFAAVNHERLPETGTVPVNGGQWRLRAWIFRGLFPSKKTFDGDFEAGTLTAEPGNLYRALVPMTVTTGGSGPLNLELVLDENSIPQPVNGTLSQPVGD